MSDPAAPPAAAPPRHDPGPGTHRLERDGEEHPETVARDWVGGDVLADVDDPR